MRTDRALVPAAATLRRATMLAPTLAVVAFGTACGTRNDATGNPKGPTPAAEAGAAHGDSATPALLTLTPAQQARIHLVTVALSAFQPTIQTTGTVAFNGDRSTQVLSPVSGPVAQLLVQPGASVSRGTPLATVSSPDFASAVAAYRKAVAAAQQAQRIADQDVQLFKTDAISRRDVEQAQTEAQSAAADREAAREQIRALGIDPASLDGGRALAAAAIRAPISGVVVERLISPGQLLQAGTTPTFTVADLTTMWVMANVFEADLGLVHRGEPVSVQTDASPTPFTGHVDYVGATVDSATRATQVRLVVQNRGDILKRAMYVNVSIRSDRQRTGIEIPDAAVLRNEENLPFVFVAVRSGTTTRYARRRITLGAHTGDRYEVLSGLTPGDQVVTEGALFLQFSESQ